MGILKLHDDLKNQRTTARALLESYINQIEQYNPKINAFINTNYDNARKKADAVDAKIQNGEEIGLLEGIPIAIKDNLVEQSMPTTCSSQMLEHYRSPYDATVIDKLNQAGAIVLGKTNMDEFAMGSTTETSFFGPTLNPHNIHHVPGGSSGGSAAAVAADMCPVALGSDTGGSIRQPAAYCGVYGLKPTYGSVSRYGLIAFASSLDQIGPFAKTPEDLAIIMNVIAGYDETDSTSAKVDHPDYLADIYENISGLRIGVPQELISSVVSDDIKERLEAAKQNLTALGAIVEEVSLPNITMTIPAYYILAVAEASSNLARFDGVRYGMRVKAETTVEMFNKTRDVGFGDEVKRRIMLGTYALSAGYYDAYYVKAQKVRRLIQEDFEKVFENYDCLLMPTTIDTALKIGEDKDAVDLYQEDLCTASANLAGLPALSFPYGKDKDDLPIGLQLVSSAFQEGLLLKVAQSLYEHDDVAKCLQAKEVE